MKMHCTGRRTHYKVPFAWPERVTQRNAHRPSHWRTNQVQPTKHQFRLSLYRASTCRDANFGDTHGAEIARPAQLPLVATVQQHLLQLVAQSVQQLPHGRLGLPGRGEKVVEVQNPRERGPGRLAPRGAAAAVAPQRDERLPRGRRHLPVPAQKPQPPPGAEDVRLLHAPRQQQVLVADGDGGENEALGVNHVRLGVHGRGEQVAHPVGGPGEEESQGGQERQEPREPPRVRAAEEDVPQAVQRGVFQEELAGFGEGARSRLRSARRVALAHVGGRTSAPAVVTVSEPQLASALSRGDRRL